MAKAPAIATGQRLDLLLKSKVESLTYRLRGLGSAVEAIGLFVEHEKCAELTDVHRGLTVLGQLVTSTAEEVENAVGELVGEVL